MSVGLLCAAVAALIARFIIIRFALQIANLKLQLVKNKSQSEQFPSAARPSNFVAPLSPPLFFFNLSMWKLIISLLNSAPGALVIYIASPTSRAFHLMRVLLLPALFILLVSHRQSFPILAIKY